MVKTKNNIVIPKNLTSEEVKMDLMANTPESLEQERQLLLEGKAFQ